MAETVGTSLYPELLIREYHYSIDTLFSLVVTSVGSLAWEINDQRNGRYSLNAVVTTPLRGYKDDILIKIIPISEGRNYLYVRSSSREGHGDFGTNTRHLLDLYDQMEILMDK